MFSHNGKKFELAYLSLMKAGCPPEVARSVPNLRSQVIVFEKNRSQLGTISATGYTPMLVVTSGGRWREALLKAGYVRSHVFIECGTLAIKADDAISSQELMGKLDALLQMKHTPGTYQPSGPGIFPTPYIEELYPFENYLIFSLKGQKYRQGYILDPISRDVKLSGQPQAVDEQFVNANGVIRAGVSEVKEVMPRSQTGARFAVAPPRGNTQSSTTGGRTSDLVTMIIRDFSNINEAVEGYLDAIRNGLYKPMRPAFTPVNLTTNGKIQAMLAAKGIYPLDFARWAAAEQADPDFKTKDGQKIPRSKFAYVGDPKDKSTWHLPIHDSAHAQNALSRVNQTHGIPKEKKASVIQKIRKAAKSKGIGVSDKPTAKQKNWMRKGKVAAMSGVSL